MLILLYVKKCGAGAVLCQYFLSYTSVLTSYFHAQGFKFIAFLELSASLEKSNGVCRFWPEFSLVLRKFSSYTYFSVSNEITLFKSWKRLIA